MIPMPQPTAALPLSISSYPAGGTALPYPSEEAALQRLEIPYSGWSNHRIQFLFGWLRPAIVLLTGMLLAAPLPGVALPPPEDLPEEVLRTEIITAARSPVDGQPLTPAEYAELQEQLQVNPQLEVLVPTKIKEDLFLLNIRKLLRTIVPFL